MTARPRQVLVEDTDSTIQYTGPWFQNTGTHANLGNIGSPSGGTLHGVNSNASFSFTFIGFQVMLYGMIDAPTTSPSGETDLTWACSVDGTSIGSESTTATPDNILALCGSTSLSNAMHTLVLQATVLNSSKTFWFDELQYAPSAGVPLDNATVIVDFSDPAIMYEDGWVNIDGGVTTQLTETGLSFDFIGAHLSWIGISAKTSGTVSRGADFSVDAAPPISVTLSTASGNVSIYNQVFFQTSLPPGKHHLNVKHYLSTTGLSLQFFRIQNATIPGSSSNGTVTSNVKTRSSAQPTPSSSSNGTTSVIPPAPSLPYNSIPKAKSSTGTAKFSTGTVAGSAVAGILVITGLILFLFFLRRRKRTAPIVQPFPLPGVDLFKASPSTTTVTELHRTSVPTIRILTTGKFARADQSPNASAIASGSNVGSTSVQSGSHPGQTLRHQDSGVRILEREDGPVMELPPLYTQG